MKIAICDDEMVFHRDLKIHLDKYAKENGLVILYDDFTNGHELLRSKNEYDIIFMDFQMDGINGLETATKLREKTIKLQ